MDTERFIEQILETENLTDALDDDDASWLLDWGIGKLDVVLDGVKDQETAGSRVSALLAVMRKMNILVGGYTEKDPQTLAADLAALHDLFAAAFPFTGTPPARPDFQATAACLSQLPSRQVLEFLAGDFFLHPE